MKNYETGTVVCPECSLASDVHEGGEFSISSDGTILQCDCGAKFRPIIERIGKPLLSAVYKWNHSDYNWDKAKYINGYWTVPSRLGFSCCHN